MLTKANINRLDLAEQVLMHWEAMLEQGHLSVENLPLARNETKNLEAYRQQDPERVDELIARFSAVAIRLAQRTN